MRIQTADLLPARRDAAVIVLLWMAALAGIVLSAGLGLRTAAGSIFAAMLLWLSFLDLRDGMLYDCITLPFAALGFVCVPAGLLSLMDALMGGTLCGVLFYCLYIAARGGLGGGDVKLAAGLGIWLGWESAVVALWIAFLLGGIAAALLLASGRRSRRDGIPFGPFLSAGGYVAFVAGADLWQLYWGLA
ncbi:A24 family peptidase [uncultured Selenomonas sp.]|uniref:prepilin peptidase n=1 Tax=uncultured Selenomonas sp. TaxID=159275 RepID=UPI0028D0776F|nr:A24 family peptidase [uncultured Selenomonas sp.]